MRPGFRTAIFNENWRKEIFLVDAIDVPILLPWWRTQIVFLFHWISHNPRAVIFVVVFIEYLLSEFGLISKAVRTFL